MKSRDIKFEQYTFLSRGSDERQYCWPGVDLPIASIMRSKYGTYPEYHTSLDNLDFISPLGLSNAFKIYVKIIQVLENNYRYKPKIFCEPQLGKRGLYNITSNESPDILVNLLAYIDGNLDLIDLSIILNVNINECQLGCELLLENELIIK